VARYRQTRGGRCSGLLTHSFYTIDGERVYVRTIDGLARVDVIYRRINDDFLEEEASRRTACSAFAA
jgi:uncharacterized circularly permuted ATP-grasp superfamily protein